VNEIGTSIFRVSWFSTPSFEVGLQTSKCRMLSSHFGGRRAALRYLLHQSELYLGRHRRFESFFPEQIRRLVFVCKGNICRSPFAEHYARTRGARAISFGLDARDGAHSPAMAVETALTFGVDLREHRGQSFASVVLLPDDLVLMFEPTQARRMHALLGNRQIAGVVLVGLFCRPRHAYLHDPYGHSPDYFRTCFARITRAVDSLIDHTPATRADL
jgi:protein-tyrosine phosphatase